MITLVQQRIKDELGLCSYCIETNKIKMFKKGETIKYNTRYMFLVFSTYPYGMAVDAEITDGKITSFSLQPVNAPDSGSFVPYTDDIAHDFLSYEQLAQKPSQVPSDDTKK
jgi:hypothetical protein